MDTMIALVSDQRMQNVIPILQADVTYGELILVTSKDRRTGETLPKYIEATEDLKAVLGSHLNVKLSAESVDPYNIEAVASTISTLINQCGGRDNLVVNMSGGTKPMAIGAYLAAQDIGVDALYVDTANEKLVWFSKGHRREEAFDLAGRLTVPIYFQANNKQIDKRRTRKSALLQKAYEAARTLLPTWPECASTLEQFGKAVSQGQDRVKISDKIAAILAQYGFVYKDGSEWVIKQQGRSFLSGKWLEAMVHVLLEDAHEFGDVKSNLCLQGVENELDVVVTRNGQLAIIECKSGSLGGQTTLNKLQAIRTGFGTFARSFFVTSRKESEVDNNFRNRAREYSVRQIITAESLLQIGEKIKSGMGGTP